MTVLIAGIVMIIVLLYLDKKLTRQRERLEQLNATKDKLFSIISHDLKSPAVAQQLATDVLVNKVKRANYTDILTLCKLLQDNTQQQVATIETLMNWTRMQTNRYSAYYRRKNKTILGSGTEQIVDNKHTVTRFVYRICRPSNDRHCRTKHHKQCHKVYSRRENHRYQLYRWRQRRQYIDCRQRSRYDTRAISCHRQPTRASRGTFRYKRRERHRTRAGVVPRPAGEEQKSSDSRKQATGRDNRRFYIEKKLINTPKIQSV